MAVTLTIRDETAAGNVTNERPLEFPSERITVRELIRERVYQEVQDHNLGDGGSFRGLVQPSDTEQVLNGKHVEYKLKQRRQIDWKQQFEKAIQAFDANAYFILIDDRQAETLEQEFTIKPGCEVSFVKLTALVGG